VVAHGDEGASGVESHSVQGHVPRCPGAGFGVALPRPDTHLGSDERKPEAASEGLGRLGIGLSLFPGAKVVNHMPHHQV